VCSFLSHRIFCNLHLLLLLPYYIRPCCSTGPTCCKILVPPLSVECSPAVRLSQHPHSLPATIPRRRRPPACKTRGTLPLPRSDAGCNFLETAALPECCLPVSLAGHRQPVSSGIRHANYRLSVTHNSQRLLTIKVTFVALKLNVCFMFI